MIISLKNLREKDEDEAQIDRYFLNINSEHVTIRKKKTQTIGLGDGYSGIEEDPSISSTVGVSFNDILDIYSQLYLYIVNCIYI